MTDIEEILLEGKAVQVKPRGYSMYPMMIPGRDEAVIEPVNIKDVRRGDCLLYRREGSIPKGHAVIHAPSGQGNSFTVSQGIPKGHTVIHAPSGRGNSYAVSQGILVLHRVVKVRKEGIYFLGDNQEVIEGPLDLSCVRGKLSVFIRNGRRISVRNPVYRLLVSLWLILRPVRKPIKKTLAYIKHKMAK